MWCLINNKLPRTRAALMHAAIFVASFVHARQSRAQDFVPGSGKRVTEVGDDFEDPKWNYIANLPKSSENIDGQARLPGGVSANGRWFEPQMRGAPDVVRMVETPAGGVPGSKGSMLMQTLWSGVPNRPSFKPQQDDFVADVASKIGLISVSRSPSVVVRVYLPPFDKWEKRTGNSFGYRACVHTTKTTMSWRRHETKGDIFWPGMFLCLYSHVDGGAKQDFAQLIVRADQMGQDVPGPRIMKGDCWYTLGMSFGANGQVNYYAREGVENLTAKDHIASYFAYSDKCEQLESFFFDLVNQDDGKSWSTPWIVDDAFLYLGDGNGVAARNDGRRQ